MPLVALVLGAVFSLGCGDSGSEPPGEQETRPSSGSVCPSEQTLTYENFGRPFLETYCTRCHGMNPPDGSRHGAPVGLDWDVLELVREHAERIDRLAAAGPSATNTTMPPSEPRPSVAERRQLGEWLVCGAPE